MNRIYPASFFVAVLVSLLSGVNSTAQDQHPLFRFLDTNTIGFARIDLATFDSDAVHNKFKELSAGHKSLLREGQKIHQIVSSFQQPLTEAGAREVFAFLSLSDFQSGLYYVIPADANTAPRIINAAKKLALMRMRLKAQRVPEGVLISTPQAAQRLRDRFLPVREDASEILALAQDSFNLVIAPSSDQSRAIRDSVGPPYPRYAGTLFTEGQLTGDLLADGMARTVLSVSTKPLGIKLTISGATSESVETSPTANQVLSEKFADALKTLQQGSIPYWPRAKRIDTFPSTVTSALSQIKVTRSQGTFTIALDEALIQKLARAIVPAFADQVGTTSDNFKSNSARQLILAIHNHYDAFRAFPKDITDEDGKPLLSWRVKILPFMDYSDLYSKFKLDEPWDSLHNRPLIDQMPSFLKTEDSLSTQGKTIWSIPQGESFMGGVSTFDEVRDGTSNTIMIVGTTAKAAAIWTKPQDWKPDTDNIKLGIFSESQSKIIFARTDGSVGSLTRKTSDDTIKSLLMVNDGHLVKPSDIK